MIQLHFVILQNENTPVGLTKILLAAPESATPSE